MDYYKKIDNWLIKRYPFAWILGVHIFGPLIVGAGIVLFAIGFLYQFDLEDFPYNGSTSTFGTITLLVSLLSILLLILFIIRQVRFNSSRIHHSLPYKHGILYFLSFLLIIGGISALPVTANTGAYLKGVIKTKEVRKTMAFYEREKWQEHIPFSMDGGNFEPLEGNEQFSQEIKSFAVDIENKNHIFYAVRLTFWKYYSLASFFVSMMLFAICSTKIRDFGWAMLIVALFPVINGILIALFGISGGLTGGDDGKGLVTFVLTVSVAFIIAMAFSRALVKPATARSYAIALYLLCPAVIMSYLTILDEDMLKYYAPVVMVVSIVATTLMNAFFKRRYVNPI